MIAIRPTEWMVGSEWLSKPVGGRADTRTGAVGTNTSGIGGSKPRDPRGRSVSYGIDAVVLHPISLLAKFGRMILVRLLPRQVGRSPLS